jgi:DNA-directed RNA polymerase specialized sigma24 family protein
MVGMDGSERRGDPESGVGAREGGGPELLELRDLLAAPEPVAAGAPDRPDASAAPRRRATSWRALLCGGSPREVLARILPGDPLGLRAHVAERLRERAYLLDADRVLLRAMARCARFAVRYRGRPELGAWLAERVDEALLDLVREDLEDLRAERAPPPERLAVFVELASPLGLDPAQAWAACTRLNLCVPEERVAFRALVLDGVSLDELARRGGQTATELARRARRALEAALTEPEDPSEAIP